MYYRTREIALCDADHDQIAFISTDCPVCSMREDFEREIEQLNKEIADLESEPDVNPETAREAE